MPPDRAAARLEARHLTRAIAGRDIVSDVSLSVGAGQVTCLLGPSGCGKSTTLRMLAGVDRQDAGEIRIDGELVTGPGVHVPPEGRHVGLMFQDFALFPHLTVARNVAFGLRGPRAERRSRALDLLGRVELARHANSYPHQLSGGEQQRVALMRALAPRPRVMLMDEPFSGLDNRLRDGIRDETLDLLKAEGTAVLLVTHEPEEAMRMADEIVLMRDGRIVQTGAPYNLYHAPADAAAAAFFSDVNVIRGTSRGRADRDAVRRLPHAGPSRRGTEVEIVFRPQHVAIDFDRHGRGPDPTPMQGTPARGVVRRARFMGSESLVEFVMDHDGSVLSAVVPAVFLPRPGVPLWLSIRRDRCFVFRRRGTRGLGLGPRGQHPVQPARLLLPAAAPGRAGDEGRQH